MADVPHERSLVKRVEGKPFTLLGIDSDDDREALKQRVAKEGITWRSWWDGNTTGSIASKWNVDYWPTLYLLDAKGVIRYKGAALRAITLKPDGKGGLQEVRALDEAVDALLGEFQTGR